MNVTDNQIGENATYDNGFFVAIGQEGNYSLRFEINRDARGGWSVYTRDESEAAGRTYFGSYEEAAAKIESLKKYVNPKRVFC